MKHIIICGYMIRFPVAGNMLAYFHTILGFCRLGIKVIYLEESGWDSSCYNLVTQNYGNDPSFGLESVQKLATNLRRDKNRKKMLERRDLFSVAFRERKDNFSSCFFWLPT